MRTVPANRHERGLCFFVTTDLRPRRPLFEIQSNALHVIQTLNYFRVHGDIALYAYVVMPDHVHFIARVADDMKLSPIVRRSKNYVAKQIGIGPIWNKGYWSEEVYGQDFVNQKMRYIHQNPVRAGLVKHETEFAYSSATDVVSGSYRIVEPIVGYPCTPFSPK